MIRQLIVLSLFMFTNNVPFAIRKERKNKIAYNQSKLRLAPLNEKKSKMWRIPKTACSRMKNNNSKKIWFISR